MQTNKQLELAYDFVQYTGQNIFLTGKAGTGKTTFLKSLKERSPKRMIVVAPTGVAAINAGGVTIHSFFQLSFGPQVGLDKTTSEQNRYNKEKINIIRSLDLLVIDEISMVRADLLDAVDRVMRRFKNKHKPFGGAQVLMIGDLQQLSPVVKSDEWNLLKREYETVYFFSSKALSETSFVSIELTYVFRQQDEKFIELLNKVRDNKLDENSMAALNQRYIPDFTLDEEEGYITLCTHNVQAQRINDTKLRQLTAKVEIFTAHLEGKFPEYSYPTELELKLKVGAQVMFVKNDPDPEKRFFNGKIGQVTKMDDESITVQCPDDDDEIEVTPLLWENIKYSVDKETAEISESVEGSFKQIPLKLAWAITIHKSQGLTFERAIIDAEASFAHGQVYVALSRCKTLEGVVLSTPIGGRSIVKDNTVGSFIQNVEDNQPGDKELNDAKLAFQKELLLDVFDFENLKIQINTINKIIRENTSTVPEIVIGQAQKIKSALYAELVDVAEKFQIQINQLLQDEPDISANKNLLERITKAARYFTKKVNAILVDDFAKVDLDVDNKAVRKQLKNVSAKLSDEIGLKLASFEICETGFEVKKLLDAKARAVIDSGRSGSKKAKAKEILDLDAIPHQELYTTLRSFRYEKSKELGIPLFMIFSQKTLIELVNYLPVEKSTLKLINGLGAKKIEQFGADIIQIIQLFCDDNGIERMEIPLKNAGKEKKPKIDSKKVSFEMYQAGKSLEEIASERALSPGTIESHLAHYVGLGKLDIKLFIAEEKLKKMLEYFESVENKSFGAAKARFGEAITYGELRMAMSYLESLNKN